MPAVSTTYFNRQDALINLTTGQGNEHFLRFLEALRGLAVTINSVPGQNRWALAAQPSLGAGDAGYLADVTDYGHKVRWTGTVWEFADGDERNKFFRLFMGAPQGVGWQLCDGTATNYLTVGGATLTTTAFTTPNPTDGTFLKKLAAYTGTIEAAIAPALSGSTGSTAPGLSGSTANESSHTHHIGGSTSFEDLTKEVQAGTNAFVANIGHAHTLDSTSGAGTAHGHGVGTLVVDGHTHPLGTLAADSAARPPALGALLYFRR